MLPGYEMIAVVMPHVPIPELFCRVNSRPGKEIPESVMYSMIEGYQEPTLEEGFSKIIRM
jgi:tRNA uridine 5-carbamoylmethylation protein Kti12